MGHTVFGDHKGPRRMRTFSFQFGTDRILLRAHVPGDVQQVGLAAGLAVFNVALPGPRAGINGGFVPLSTAGALEACEQQDTPQKLAGIS